MSKETNVQSLIDELKKQNKQLYQQWKHNNDAEAGKQYQKNANKIHQLKKELTQNSITITNNEVSLKRQSLYNSFKIKANKEIERLKQTGQHKQAKQAEESLYYATLRYKYGWCL